MKERINQYIRTWEYRCYSDGLPDDAPQEIFDRVPSYKRICIAILKNDVSLETLGFTKNKCQAYNELKRIEFKQNPKKTTAIKDKVSKRIGDLEVELKQKQDELNELYEVVKGFTVDAARTDRIIKSMEEINSRIRSIKRQITYNKEKLK